MSLPEWTGDVIDTLPLIMGAGNALGLDFFDPQTQKGTSGYQGVVEPYTAVQDRVSYDDTNRRPGSGGRRYFTDMVYATPGELNRPTVDEAQQATAQQAGALQSQYAQQNPTGGYPQGGQSMQSILDEIMAQRDPADQQQDTYQDDGVMAWLLSLFQGQGDTPASTGDNAPPATTTPDPAYANNEGLSQGDIGPTKNITYDTNLMYKPNSGTAWVYGDDGSLERRTGDYYQVDVGDGNFDRYSSLEAAQAAAAARSGDFYNDFTPNNPYASQQGYAMGGMVKSPSDGMADEIQAIIGGQQPAALSGGEFVIPADVVSMAGNGNTDAGAKVFDDVLASLRTEKTGSAKQAPQMDVRAKLQEILG